MSSFAAEQCSEELKLSSNYEAIPCSKANNPTKVTHFDANWIGKDSDKEFTMKFARGKLEWKSHLKTHAKSQG